MSNMINPKPRFGFNPTTHTIYDYVAGRDVALTDRYSAVDGVWDLNQVAALIMADKQIEGARIGPPSAAAAPGAPITFTPIQAAALGLVGVEVLSAADAERIKSTMTPARAIALKLTAEQKAFLGLEA